ncbi:hypothetical protein Tco_0369844 [Tanacetum coccineum]
MIRWINGKVVLEQIVARHGKPCLNICDRDGKGSLPKFEIIFKNFGYGYYMNTGVCILKLTPERRTMSNSRGHATACVIGFCTVWVAFAIADFSYNKQFTPSIKAATPMKHLWRNVVSPICWAEGWGSPTDWSQVNPQETTEKIVLIKQRMQAAQDRQKSYADRKRKPMEFEVGDRVMAQVTPWKGVLRIRLELPQELSRVHHTFHVSNLKKCYADEPLVMPLEGIHVDDKLQFVEEPVEIMEREIKRLKRSRIPLVKVRWNSRRGPEFTWEREDSFKQKYPQLFTNRASSSTTRS